MRRAGSRAAGRTHAGRARPDGGRNRLAIVPGRTQPRISRAGLAAKRRACSARRKPRRTRSGESAPMPGVCDAAGQDFDGDCARMNADRAIELQEQAWRLQAEGKLDEAFLACGEALRLMEE